MENNIEVLLFDISNNIIEGTNIERPNTYQKLRETLKNKLKKLPKYFEIFIQSIDGKAVIINDNQNYKLINDIIFIREFNADNLGKSIFQLNYDKLSESHQDILDERFNCSVCLNKIKNEKPLFCYKCQKIFHNNCLNDWDKKMKLQNKKLSCPNCRNELPLEKWEHKLDFEDIRKNEADKMNKFSQYDLILNINKAQEIKINELHVENEKQKKKLEESFKFIKEILFKVEEIINIINPNNNNNINDYLKKLSIKNENFPYKDFSQIANKKLEMIKNNIKYKNNKLINTVEKVQDEMNLETLIKSINPSQSLNMVHILNNKNINPNNNNKPPQIKKPFFKKFKSGIISNIIKNEGELALITQRIQIYLNKNINYNILFFSKIDGDKAATFHQKCDRARQSLILIMDSEGNRFGGFTMRTWCGKNIQKKDAGAFVFSIDKNKIFPIIPDEVAIGCYPYFGPVFLGCQIRVYDNFFTKGGSTYLRGMNYLTEEDYELTNGKQTFEIKELEVYEVSTV